MKSKERREDRKEENEFKEYLKQFLNDIIPSRFNNSEIL